MNRRELHATKIQHQEQGSSSKLRKERPYPEKSPNDQKQADRVISSYSHDPHPIIGMELIGKGDLTERIDVKRSDELGVLANGFNEMASSLRTVLSSVNDHATQLSASAEELSASSELSA